MELQTVFWDEDRFNRSENEWQQLLAQSDADALFLSWHWMHGWWQIFRKYSQELRILGVYRDEQLIGIAPLHLHRGLYLGGKLPSKRLELLGSCSGKPAGLLSEYLGFVLHRDFEKKALEAIIDSLDKLTSWQEIRLQHIPLESPLNNVLHHLGKIRELDRSTGYPIDTRGSFEDYLAGLGRNTRLKLFNRRKLLAGLGTVELRPVEEGGIDRLIDALNEFDKIRFGHDSTINALARRQFHQLHDSMPGLSITSHSSLLYLDDELLSVIINFRLGRCVYNMQLGYRPDFHKKISLGTLHLGYALEAAFEDPEIDRFDLLLGSGKNSDYKRHLTDRRREAASWQVLRSPLLRTLFAINDGGKALLRRLSSS